jgi:hypothetical protein
MKLHQNPKLTLWKRRNPKATYLSVLVGLLVHMLLRFRLDSGPRAKACRRLLKGKRVLWTPMNEQTRNVLSLMP